MDKHSKNSYVSTQEKTETIFLKPTQKILKTLTQEKENPMKENKGTKPTLINTGTNSGTQNNLIWAPFLFTGTHPITHPHEH